MNKTNFIQLQRGDIVRPVGDHRTFIVTANYGSRVATVDLTNPPEWELVGKLHQKNKNE